MLTLHVLGAAQHHIAFMLPIPLQCDSTLGSTPLEVSFKSVWLLLYATLPTSLTKQLLADRLMWGVTHCCDHMLRKHPNKSSPQLLIQINHLVATCANGPTILNCTGTAGSSPYDSPGVWRPQSNHSWCAC
jgi:hypothetical protein